MKFELASVERLNLGLSAGAVAASLALVSPHFAGSLAAGAFLEALNLGAIHRGAKRLFRGEIEGARTWVGLFSMRFLTLAAAIFALGCLSIWINYDSDRQRQEFRASGGKKKVWGKKPVIVEAEYKVAKDGRTVTKKSILLASGWWAIARHFHYLPEISASFFWTAPALFGKLPPYLYVIFLTVLLIDRSMRDDTRCSLKYGKHWKKYCELVPYKIVPGIF